MSAGKGSSPRPYSIPADEFATRHEAIFGKREKKPYIPPQLSETKPVDEQEVSKENDS